MVMGIVLAIFQQWCGINVVFNYAKGSLEAIEDELGAVLEEK